MAVQGTAMWVLQVLAHQKGEGASEAMVGPDLAKHTGLSPSEINDAVQVLIHEGYVETTPPTIDARPYWFTDVTITAAGRTSLKS